MGSIQDLNDHNGHIPLSRLEGRVTEPLGYMMLRVQIPYMPSYDEDQVVLVVVEDSGFLQRCQVILGTPTINRAVRAMKESEMENTPGSLEKCPTHIRVCQLHGPIGPGGLRHDYAHQYG